MYRRFSTPIVPALVPGIVLCPRPPRALIHVEFSIQPFFAGRRELPALVKMAGLINSEGH
jgi:hypothetical protein